MELNNYKKWADGVIRFTKAYKENSDKPLAIREALCLKEQFPTVLDDLVEGDIIAGRSGLDNYVVKLTPQGFDSYKFQQSGYSINIPMMHAIAKNLPEYADAMKEIEGFWTGECTDDRDKALWANDEDMAICEDRLIKYPLGCGGIIRGRCIRIAGLMLDYEKLIKLGISGLRAEIANVAEKADDKSLYEAMNIALDIFADACDYYRIMALEKAKTTNNSQWKADLLDMANALGKIAVHTPDTMKEAIQLLWLYNVLAGVNSFTRIDIYLGDLFVDDIDNKGIPYEEQIRILTSLWTIIDETVITSDGRIFVGGKGRPNEKNADRFALAAIDTTHRFKRIMPTLTLRFYEGQDPILMEKALDCIGDGCLYPLLYNDDVYIEGFAKCAEISVEDAVSYLPLGCGEMNLWRRSIASPNTALLLPKVLEAMLHNGRDPINGMRIGIDVGNLSDFDTFDKLYDAYKREFDYAAMVAAKSHKYEYEAERTQCSFLFPSMLTDDCIARGKALVDGGIRYSAGCTEGFGLTNTADSLYVIKKLVYEDEIMSLEKMVEILDKNFVGYEKEQKLMKSLPKFGNDNDEVDAMVQDLSSYTNKIVQREGKKVGLDFFLISSVNPGGIEHGVAVGATPDGRLCGHAFAVGNSPTAGNDKNGITAMLNSVTKVDSINGGYITNVKISPEMFHKHREIMNNLLKVYWAKGGAQLNITVVNRGDLEKALVEPEKYTHVLVRVGGWSARFIDLEPMIKQEVLTRTLY